MKPASTGHPFTGHLFLLAFVLFTAVQDTYLGNLLQKEQPMVVIAATYGFAMLFFLALEFRSLPKLKQLIRQHGRTLLYFNMTTLCSLGAIFFSLMYIEPAIASMISFSLGPIIGAFGWRWLRPQSPILRSEKVASAGVFLGLLILVVATLRGKSSIAFSTKKAAFLGIAFAVISSLGAVGSTFLSKRLSEHGVGTSTIMSVRFFLLTLVGVFFSLFSGKIHAPLGTFLVMMVLLSIGTVIIPMFLVQKGLERSEPMTVFLILPTTPVFVYLLQMFDPRLHLSWMTLLGIGISLASSVLGIWGRKQMNPSLKLENK